MPQTIPASGRSALLRLLAALLGDPARFLAGVLALNAVTWVLVPAVLHAAPPLDVVEGYMWGREWVLATYKHPALPSWLIEASRRLSGGAVGWPVAIVAQGVAALTIWSVFLLGRGIFGDARAAAAALGLLALEHFTWMSPSFNHTQAQMLGWALVVLCLWRAVETGRLIWWAGLGAAAAIAFFSKLSSAIFALAPLVWLIMDVEGRKTFKTSGPYVAAAVLLVLTAPLALWLVTNNFAPLAYAEGRAGNFAVVGSFLFLANVVLVAVPMLLVFALAGLFGPRREKQTDVAASIDRRATVYLATMTFLPAIAAVVLAAGRGSGLRSTWLAPVLTTLAPLLAALFVPNLDRTVVRRILLGSAVVPVLSAIVYGATVLLPLGSKSPVRVNFPQSEIARRMQAIWNRETGKPLKIVAGDMWIAGLVGITASDQPSILTEGDLALSPWITPERLGREGALVMWPNTVEPPTAAAKALIGGRSVGEERFMTVRGDRREIVVRYAIVPPRPR